MKRSTIIASVTAVAVIGGAAVASASLTGSDASPAAQELQAAADADRAEAEGEGEGDNGGESDGSRVQGGGADPSPEGEDGGDGGNGGDGGAPADERTGVAEQVVATAEDAVPGYVIEVELELDDGYWEVDVAGDDGREHELKISLDGAEVLQREREDDDDVRAKHRLLADADVRAADAARIAEEHLGGHAKEVDLDRDDREWEVELRDADGAEWELAVDVRTGEIRDVERDD